MNIHKHFYILIFFVFYLVNSLEFFSYKPSDFERLLSRKRRYLMFPPGSGVACTFSMVKALIYTYPTGYNTVSEMNFAYPIPDEMFYLKKLKLIEKLRKKKKPTKPPMKPDIIKWQPQVWTQGWNSWSPSSKYKRSVNDNLAEIHHDHEIKSHLSYREKRDLYKNLEEIIDYVNVTAINRACILKAICEARHFLFPKGTSLFHDIFRILFTVPNTDSTSHEHRKAMNLQEHECHEEFRETCPISILEMFLYKDRII
ncbi:uncharacterized protein DMENIID0001_064040 [Sergentomyia squamirostris]